MTRLTKKIRQKLLEQNEGFEESTYYQSKNFREERRYKIEDGKLRIRSIGKTSWADSRFDDSYDADESQTHYFLKKFFDALNTDGID